MSGGAAVWAAAEEKALIRALVLIDPFVDGDSDPFLVVLLSLLFARPWGASSWIKYYSSLYPTRKPADFADYTRKLRENLTQPGRIEAVMAMLKASKKSSGERLSSVTQPVLVLMGSKDPDFKDPITEADRISGLLNARKKIIQDAGHYPHAEMPEVTGAVLLQFLQSISGGDHD
jgi:pimeloyl-ACP methyl ester carboxylesterase